MNIQTELKKLRDNRLLRNSDEINEFESAIANIVELEDADHIEYLCQGFDDSTEEDEVMFGLIHAIESYDNKFDGEITLKKFAEAVPSMLPHAKEWSKIMHKRILNHEPSRITYSKIIKELDKEIQSKIVDQLVEIKNKNPKRFEAYANQIIEHL
ncbi:MULTISPECIES: Imm30 family immunity protein [Bacillus]|uniref:Imm30 family immunity protein n=1 Tax=Bacillus TaxID=1386 RepID=UPI002DBF1DA4|nr:Imm30 family immunity protein [Bacillus glycinifermentans]MEC3606268.1 Imm30 family immunity protein [Bacillus glycinifermentans]